MRAIVIVGLIPAAPALRAADHDANAKAALALAAARAAEKKADTTAAELEAVKKELAELKAGRAKEAPTWVRNVRAIDGTWLKQFSDGHFESCVECNQAAGAVMGIPITGSACPGGCASCPAGACQVAGACGVAGCGTMTLGTVTYLPAYAAGASSYYPWGSYYVTGGYYSARPGAVAGGCASCGQGRR